MNKGGMWTWIAGIAVGLFLIIWAVPQFTKQSDKINVAGEVQDNSMELDKLTMQIASAGHFFRDDPDGLKSAKARLTVLRADRDRQMAEKNGTGQAVIVGQPVTITQPGQPVAAALATQPIVISEKEMKQLKAKAMSGI